MTEKNKTQKGRGIKTGQVTFRLLIIIEWNVLQ